MRGNIAAIMQKEMARFFGDRQMLFNTVLLPGLLIYIIYSLMGSGISQMVSQGQDEVVAVWVENMPAGLSWMPEGGEGSMVVVERAFGQGSVDSLADKDINAVLVRFPAGFDSLVAAFPAGEVPNVEIYYNSTNNAASRAYTQLTQMLEQRYSAYTVNAPQFEGQHYDQATPDAIGAMVWSKLLPMLIVMLLFSGVMSLAPSSIAGEKERGTIATLLVTPMRRSELALGKVLSLSCLSLLSGLSSFIGIALSLPRMMQADGGTIGMAVHYAAADYLALLLVIFSTMLLLVALVSILSAWAKDVKNAGTMVTPLMLLVMLVGLLPMFQGDAEVSWGVSLIPFYNSIEAMTAIFSHQMQPLMVLTTLAANVAYTAAAVWVLTRMFNSERVMFRR